LKFKWLDLAICKVFDFEILGGCILASLQKDPIVGFANE